jgi:S-adenosylmethionine hydrolase
MVKKTIALISDFGLHDPFVGILKGVINNTAKETIFIDQ